MEKHGVAVDEGRSPCPRIVAAVMLLDLDHLGAHVAKDHAGHRPRHRLPDLDHPDARKRPGHGVSPFFHPSFRGAPLRASPESITTSGGYGFRACAPKRGASRNDG